MKALLYARVSDPNTQDTEDKASIDQQLQNMRELCKRNGWQIAGEFVDREYYRATQAPNKGKMVNPSGERADRPQFLAMLEVVKTGDADTVLYWRDDRLVRHPRVAVVVEDALDIGDVARNGKGRIELRDATGAVLDRFTLAIKAAIWREENKRRAERIRMGKVATLQQGYWPGPYKRFGYRTRKGPRGRIIEIEKDEAQTVGQICEMFDAGKGVREIRRYLMANGIEQKGRQLKQHEWDTTMIYNILHDEDYVGTATWRFGDGTTMTIEIPAIIDRELWERNRVRFQRNKELSTRNSRGIYLLQGIAFCGDCGSSLHVRQKRNYTSRTGEKRPYKVRPHYYYCGFANRYPEEPHPNPFTTAGTKLDWLVWRQVVDLGIQQPDVIREQVQERRVELLAQGDSVDSDISHVRRRLAEVNNERAFYQRQAARGKLTEHEFDIRMEETEEALQHWQTELAQLQELRDNWAQVQTELDYATKFLTALQDKLTETDIPPDELKALPEERRNEILKERRKIIRALVNKVLVRADGQVRIEGLLDGSEAAQFDLGILWNHSQLP